MTTGVRCALVIEVRFPGGRFHGSRRVGLDRNESVVPEWPPSPFRLFQALVAGCYSGRWAAEEAGPKDTALGWLESLEAPVVAAAAAHPSSPVTYYVPNNDLDAVGGDPDRVNEIRVAKRRRASLIRRDEPVVYAWSFDRATLPHAELLCQLAERLHTLGHGIDCAFAAASVLDEAACQQRLSAHGGIVRRPGTEAGATQGTPCPAPGSLSSLKRRHLGLQQRFRLAVDGKKTVVEFRQPPRAHLRLVGYGTAPDRVLFELRDAGQTTAFQPTPHTRAAALVKRVRDLAFERLAAALPARRPAFEAAIIGRGDPAPDPGTRVRFVPLPSIGIEHTSPSIRRVLVEVPPRAALTNDELRWALSGRVFGGHSDADGVLCGQTLLVAVDSPAVNDRMVSRYMRGSTLWRSVTPVVLPLRHRLSEKIDGDGLVGRLEDGSVAVTQALRHADVQARPVSVRLQREPLRRRGRHTSDHDADRFGGARLHHLELRLDRAVQGPLVLGDGRWLGLGVMAPVIEAPDGLHVFHIDGQQPPKAMAPELARALRRAVMSLAQAAWGVGRELPLFFTGHQADGRPAASESHRHLFYLADDAGGNGRLDRLAIVAPTLPPAATHAERREHERHLETLERAVRALTRLRAGPAGSLTLQTASAGDDDPIFGGGRLWISRTAYRPTRQPKTNIEAAIADDVRRECARRHLPVPRQVRVADAERGARGRVCARVRIEFANPVAGPLLLGDGAHFGRSLFERESDDSRTAPGSGGSSSER